LFADDTNFLIPGSDEVGLQHKIKNVMRELEVWFEKNNLIIKFEKKKHLLCRFIQNKRVPLRPQINFKTIEITEIFRYLHHRKPKIGCPHLIFKS
jgi:hypothetical protein